VKTLISDRSFGRSLSFVAIRVIILCCFLLLSTLSVQAETTATSDSKKLEDASLHVISDKMVAKRESSMVDFIGNVKATRLDSIIYADSIQVFFHENTSKENNNENNVKKIIATGNVKYTAGERKAFADKAIYTTHDEVLILTGKTAKLVTGTSFVTGKKITLYRIEGKVIVESDGSNRVEALFNPEDNK